MGDSTFVPYAAKPSWEDKYCQDHGLFPMRQLDHSRRPKPGRSNGLWPLRNTHQECRELAITATKPMAPGGAGRSGGGSSSGDPGTG